MAWGDRPTILKIFDFVRIVRMGRMEKSIYYNFLNNLFFIVLLQPIFSNMFEGMYKWMKKYIEAYKANKKCPKLVD